MPSQARIVIDPTRCRGHGTCVALLPLHLELDPWHFPIVTNAMLTGDDLEVARHAEHLCPELAFHVVMERRPR